MKARLCSFIIIIPLLFFTACSIYQPKEAANEETEGRLLKDGDVVIEKMTQKQKLSLPYSFYYEFEGESLGELEEITREKDYAIMKVKVLNEPRRTVQKSGLGANEATLTKVRVLEIYEKSESLDIKVGDVVIIGEDYVIKSDKNVVLNMYSNYYCTPLEDDKEYILFTQYDTESWIEIYWIVNGGGYLISDSENISEHQKTDEYQRMLKQVKTKYLRGEQ